MDALERYVEDPSLDSDARRKMVEEQAFRVDGGAGQRVAEAVLDALSSPIGSALQNRC